MTERFIGMMAGTWLASSAFIWRHAPLQKANAIVCGCLAIAIAILDISAPRARFLAGVLALWIFLSAILTVSLAEMTLWNNVVCAVAIVVSAHASGPRRTAFS
jgi:hypothetical protein